MRTRNRLLLISIVLGGIFAALSAGVVLAQGPDLGGKVLTGSSVTVPTGTVDHDVYAFAGTITSNATINGELVAAGGTIIVNGSVQGDVIATGGQVSINGSVGGHVRAAGGQITIDGSVTKDVLAAGGTVTLGGGSRVGGDLLVSGGRLDLLGTVSGSAVGSVGSYSKTGSIAGTDSITVSQSQPGPAPAPSNPVLDAIRQFVAVVLVGLLVLWLWPRVIRSAEAEVRERPLPAFGWGIVGAIGYVVALIVIAVAAALIAVVLGALGFVGLAGIDIFGGFVALLGLTLAFIVVVAFLADAVVALALARFALARSRATGAPPPGVDMPSTERRDRWSDFLPFVVGVAVVVILTALPIVGPWVKLVVVLLGLGALVWAIWRRPRAPVPAAAFVPPPAPAPPSTPATS